MHIGFVKAEGDPRCPVTPESINKYSELGCEVCLEQGIGHSIAETFEDIDGVSVLPRADVIAQSDILYSHEPLPRSEMKGLKSGAIVVSFFAPFDPENTLDDLDGLDVDAFSMDMIPRTTLAQSMDVLSSMASIAGYKAVLLAAEELPRYFPMMMTAAGTVKPATVVILGAGVAGLQAIATAKRLGAIVEASDVRPAVKEEVESLGGKFIEVEGARDDEEAGGYAVEQSEEYKKRQQEKVAERISKADVVITTAQLRGKPAPTLITEEMVKSMKYGSVIVDMAASSGGNCALTEDEKTVVKHGVKIIGNSFLANDAVIDASMLLSNNIFNYINEFIAEGQIKIDLENEIIRESQVYTSKNT